MHLEVVYDPTKQLGALVDTDTGLSWGPAMAGESAGEILQAWVDSVPFDMEGASPDLAASFFRSFVGRVLTAGDESPPAATSAPESPPPAGSDAQAALAEQTAQASAGEPPAPQPADTDPTAGAPEPPPAPADAPAGEPASTPAPPATTTESKPCPNCNGTGEIQPDGGGPASACGFCNGQGTVQVPATA